MAEIAITRMSSKGQVVIPSEFREGFEEGEKILVIKSDDKLILKKARDMDETLKDDLIFAKRTEEAWKRYEKGEFKSMSADNFLKELEKW
ncbi:AbrB/MazE/SpoVT family DNA-binding domain-containing protein [Candidatus Woesearchaeota archaeon]|nr:AbrB/MazE/SpoVT family DNA-binding domain-containing protein [Candidatus Woesearchaeota archaeon]